MRDCGAPAALVWKLRPTKVCVIAVGGYAKTLRRTHPGRQVALYASRMAKLLQANHRRRHTTNLPITTPPSYTTS